VATVWPQTRQVEWNICARSRRWINLFTLTPLGLGIRLELQFLGLGENAVKERGGVDCGLPILESDDHITSQSLRIDNLGLIICSHLASLRHRPAICLSAGKPKGDGVASKRKPPPAKGWLPGRFCPAGLTSAMGPMVVLSGRESMVTFNVAEGYIAANRTQSPLSSEPTRDPTVMRARPLSMLTEAVRAISADCSRTLRDRRCLGRRVKHVAAAIHVVIVVAERNGSGRFCGWSSLRCLGRA
jgi:hypothetical protein